ncbi:hypothetical protein PR048_028820 [Dryococelus australis]|uniref:Uncharacterized protein n=1 Tax=Dryococelus australis TaxID=614101 RepID=A0ABQ9GBN6_9NEOP|nr:hypothetical protein PR048_028820 [Dryococelus australis]
MLTIDERVEIILLCGRERETHRETLQQTPIRGTLNDSQFRKALVELDVPLTTLQRILKKHKLHPYQLHVMHHMTEADLDRRVEMCSWFLEHLEEDKDF